MSALFFRVVLRNIFKNLTTRKTNLYDNNEEAFFKDLNLPLSLGVLRKPYLDKQLTQGTEIYFYYVKLITKR